MLTISLIRSSGAKDLYLQLYEGVKSLILSGQIAPNQKLPSKKKLAEHLNISVKTVENAYFQLTLEGYVYSKEKVGYFASPIEGFMRKAAAPARPPFVNRYRETIYPINVRSNATPEHLFPLSVWNRLGREAITEHGDALLHTVPFNGIPELRVAISRHLQDFHGMAVSPDQIIIGSGTEYLYGRILELLGPQTVIGMEDPGYAHIRTIMASQSIPVRAIAVDQDGLDPALLEQSDCTAAHVSPMSSFPLGGTLPVQRRVDLLRWVNREPGRYLIEDNYNCEYLYQGAPVPTLFSQDVRGKVIHLNTFSKTVAPGLRIAYMVLPEELMERYLQTMSFYSCTVSGIAQHQLASFIRNGHLERHIHRVRQHNLQQRKIVSDAVAASALAPLIDVQRFPAGTHFLLNLQTDIPDQQIKDQLKNRGILAYFVSDYCENQLERFRSRLIINYSRVTEEEMRQLLAELERILKPERAFG